DAQNGYVATDGWTDTSTVKALDLVKDLERIGVATIAYTDIAKDGMLKGPNLKEQSEINQSTNMNVIASGGITTKQDVDNLAARHLYGAISGKALYDGKINFESLMEGKSKCIKESSPAKTSSADQLSSGGSIEMSKERLIQVNLQRSMNRLERMVCTWVIYM